MVINSFSLGQPLALVPIRIPADIVWGPDSPVFTLSVMHQSNFGVSLQAIRWTGDGAILVKDAAGNRVFSGSTSTGQPTHIHSKLPKITVAAPLQITVPSGSSGTVYFYGHVG